MIRTLFLTLAVPALCAGARAEPPKAPALGFAEFRNKGDTARAEVTDAGTLIRVTCPRGIGDFAVSAKKGEWPEQVSVLFEGLNELEHFEFATGRMRVQGSRAASGAFALYFVGDDGDFNKRSKVGTLDVKVERRKDGVLVTFPGKLFADAETVRFGWINWLRR